MKKAETCQQATEVKGHDSPNFDLDKI